MRQGYLYSGLLHGFILLLVLLGLPDWFRHKPPEEQPIAVQLVNVSDLTRALKRNPHPIEQAKIDTPPPDNPSKAPKPTQPDPLAPPPPPPAAAARTPDDQQDDDTPPPPEKQKSKPTPPAPPPPPQPSPTPTPPPPKPKPPKQVAKVTPPKTLKPPKKDVKPTKKKAPKANQDLDFDSMLKNLSSEATSLEKSNQPPKHVVRQPPPEEASAQPDAPLGDQLSTSEIDAVRAQIEKCWSPPGGGKDEDKIVVPIRLVINADGTIANSQIVDSSGLYNSNPLWQAVADSAVRAVENPACSPLKLPPDKYDNWKNTTVNFSPQDLE